MGLGRIVVGVSGLSLSAEERDLLQHPAVGGVILFSRNYAEPAQVTALVEDIHRLRAEHPLLVCVDHEGGRVQRFREGFIHLPPARAFGHVYDRDPRRAKHLAQEAGWLMASELRTVGVDFSFAPVLDLDRGISQVIGDRAFHTDPDAVASLAHSFLIGMHDSGMATTGKHFPGHGGVEVDSHLDVAVDHRSYADLEAEDLVPFERMIRWGLAAVMPAHVVYPEVDEAPAGFSRRWLQDILRGRLGFQGVIFSDDLEMEGARVAGDHVARGRAAIEAGCDMVLVCNKPDLIAAVVDGLQLPPDPAVHVRLARLHGRHSLTREQLQGSERWRNAVALLRDLEQRAQT